MGGGKPFKQIQGKIYIMEGDEYITEDDPKGDTKIDRNGNLLGGERFKAQTFVLPNRHPERMYMLAIDAARTSGFRDSLYYFRRNPLALKLNATQAEKEYLIEQGKLGSHLKTRSVTLVTARSAFKLHGAKMLIDGRWVVDDYYEDKVLEEITAKGLKPGDLVGELQDSNATNEVAALTGGAGGGGQGGKNERGGAGVGMYRAGGPTTIFGGSGWGPYSDGPLNAVRKSYLTREGVNEENWMYVAAERTLDATNEWAKLRRENLKLAGGIYGDLVESEEDVQRGEKRAASEVPPDQASRKRRAKESDLPLGIYEPQTGIVFYRSDTQPTQARWEALPDDGEQRRVLGGTKVGGGAWGIAWVDTVMEVPPEPEDPWTQERERYKDLLDTRSS
ncbi:hypothetical protein FKP32DRAFT_1578774 [Trametes sanguinea]|nr:hypothetical protein FKP32DRAFT_1578774 [Trametes sanguinea]